jgi:hypothetical protein
LPDDQEDDSSWDTWYLHQDITYECISFYATAHADEEDVILFEKGTVESEYVKMSSMMGRIKATGMGCGSVQLAQRV